MQNYFKEKAEQGKHEFQKIYYLVFSGQIWNKNANDQFGDKAKAK